MTKEQNNAILSEIRRLARELPSGQRDAIINKCNRLQSRLDRGRIPPDFDPAEDTAVHGTQRQVILDWLNKGNTITSKQAIDMFGITRLSAVIMQIEMATGKAPNRRDIIVPTRYGGSVRVRQYWIEQEENSTSNQ